MEYYNMFFIQKKLIIYHFPSYEVEFGQTFYGPFDYFAQNVSLNRRQFVKAKYVARLNSLSLR